MLQEMSGQGHCAAYRDQLIEAAEKLLEINTTILEQAIADETVSNQLVVEMHEGRQLVFLISLHRAETGCATNILRLATNVLPWQDIDPIEAIPWVERATGLELSGIATPGHCHYVALKTHHSYWRSRCRENHYYQQLISSPR